VVVSGVVSVIVHVPAAFAVTPPPDPGPASVLIANSDCGPSSTNSKTANPPGAGLTPAAAQVGPEELGEHGTEPLRNANVAAEPPPPQAAPSTVGALALDVKSMEYPYQSTTKSVNWDPNGAEAS
jgi:hypothetical protein